jgi:hypothetical protein
VFVVDQALETTKPVQPTEVAEVGDPGDKLDTGLGPGGDGVPVDVP